MAEILQTKYTTLSNAGGATLIKVDDIYTLYVLEGTGALAGDWTVTPSAAQDETLITIRMATTFLLNGHNFNIFGQNLEQKQLNNTQVTCFYNSDTAAWIVSVSNDFNASGFITTGMVADTNITNDKLATLNQGYIKVGNASNRPTDVDFTANGYIGIGDGTTYNSVAVSGDITISSAGVTNISAGAIMNADVNAAAAIAYSKLAPLTSANILVGSAGNVATSVAMSGNVAISNTGVTTIQPGVITSSMLATNGAKEVFSFTVSFEANEQCNNTIVVPFAGTIDAIYAYVTHTMSGANDGTIVAQISGVPVTTGTITIVASSAVNTAVSVVPTALNVFAAGNALSFVTAKATVGGKALISVLVTRS